MTSLFQHMATIWPPDNPKQNEQKKNKQKKKTNKQTKKKTKTKRKRTNNNNKNTPQQKHHLGTVSNKLLRGLNRFLACATVGFVTRNVTPPPIPPPPPKKRNKNTCLQFFSMTTG